MMTATSLTTNVSVPKVDTLVTDIMTANVTLSAVEPIVSNEIAYIFRIVNYATIGQTVAVFGMCSNIINLIVFYRMGFKETTNISLFGLGLSDFISCLTVAWANLCLTPAFQELNLPISPQETQYLTGGWPHVIFARITECITAYVAFERCICVTFPLRVKNLITPKRVKILLVCIYVFILALHSPLYYINQMAWKFYPHLNKTLLGLVFTHDRPEVERWLYPTAGAFLPVVLFTSVIVCTVVIVVNLKKKSQWRKNATASSSASAPSRTSRDARVSAMVVLISAVFITCFTPIIILSVAMTIEPEGSVDGRYQNLFEIFFSFNFIMESVNASINIFIYYFRSSNYKTIFDQIFFKKKAKK